MKLEGSNRLVKREMGMTKTVGNRVERNRALVILTAILSVFFKFIELITDSIFKFLHRNAESKKLPPIENHILMQSATSLASKIRNQSVSSHADDIQDDN